MTKKLPLHIKLQRKPISRACEFCHQKHLQCDSTRPCKNCVKRNVADYCRDVQRKRTKSKSTGSSGPKGIRKPSGNLKAPRFQNVGKSEEDQRSIVAGIETSSEPLVSLDYPTVTATINDISVEPAVTDPGDLLNSKFDNDTPESKGPTVYVDPSPIIQASNNDINVNGDDINVSTNNNHNITSIDVDDNSIVSHHSADSSHLKQNSTTPPQRPTECVNATDDTNDGIINNLDADFDFFDDVADLAGGANFGLQNQSPDDQGISNLFYDGLNNQMIFRPFIKLGDHENIINSGSSSDDPALVKNVIAPQIIGKQQSPTQQPFADNNTHQMNASPNSFGQNMYNNHNSNQSSAFANNEEPLMMKAKPIHKLTTQDFVNSFKRANSYKSPLFIRKKVFQEVGDLYSKFPVFDLNRLYQNEAHNVINADIQNPYSDLKYIIGILSFSYMKSYQELIKYFYDRLYLQNISDYDYTGLSEEEVVQSKTIRRKLFFKILEKIWTIHNYFRIQSALIQTDLTNLTNFSDSLLTELMFHRQLLNFENMINNLTSTPAIIWRRSTEIVFMSDEICTLIGIKNKAKFLSKRRFLCEIIDDMSILNYFKLINNVLLGNKDPPGGGGHHHHAQKRFDNNHFGSDLVDILENELSDERINNGSGVTNGGLIRLNCKFINHNYKGERRPAHTSEDNNKGHLNNNNPMFGLRRNQSNASLLKNGSLFRGSSIDNFHVFESNIHARGAGAKPYSKEINEDFEQQQKFISCSSILTIKMDMFDIPMLIVGQFLPILE
ncbi:hypothetical protein DASC09_028530 [Saccharomycopsis crataegensis]|uniref:Glucose starvation modulator protein 1 n=1 Tax=Saccharomycopsis crataegensis TaxID=43959 RepID=A0AAV5QL66_9ASCO|nr:hypothetical protein DASC09_028530 [Saccharomycopsis crataegensis]